MSLFGSAKQSRTPRDGVQSRLLSMEGAVDVVIIGTGLTESITAA